MTEILSDNSQVSKHTNLLKTIIHLRISGKRTMDFAGLRFHMDGCWGMSTKISCGRGAIDEQRHGATSTVCTRCVTNRIGSFKNYGNRSEA